MNNIDHVLNVQNVKEYFIVIENAFKLRTENSVNIEHILKLSFDLTTA